MGTFINQSSSLPWAIWISLCFHSILEVIPMRYNEHMAVIVFFCLTSIAMLLSFFLQIWRPKNTSCYTIFDFWYVHTYWHISVLFYSIFSDTYIELSALVSGMFLHVSTTILFESADGHRFNTTKNHYNLWNYFCCVVNWLIIF